MVDFRFVSPELNWEGCCDPEERAIYVFGKQHTPESVVATLTHESLHYALAKTVSYEAYDKYDRIYGEVEK